MSFASFAQAARPLRCFVGLFLFACSALAAAAESSDRVALPGHLVPMLGSATRVEAESADSTQTLTIVLQRTDQAGFDAYLGRLQDPAAADFRKYLAPQEVADRFGPSVDDYAAVKTYFATQNLRIIEESANRLTLVVSGERDRLAAALGTEIREYEIVGRTFSANVGDPRLPADIARRVQAIAGLSTLATPRPMFRAINRVFCKGEGEAAGYTRTNILADGYNECRTAIKDCTAKGRINADDETQIIGVCNQFHYPPTSPREHGDAPSGGPVPWKDADGAGQTVGITAFDTYARSDVADYLGYFGLPANTIQNLSDVHVGGGAATGTDQGEVLLDIDTVMLIAPGASVVVYDAPFSGAGTFQNLFNRMINDGVTIISNSWAYCEDQTTLADVTSIDSVLAAATASGITVFTASGDSGSTCLDGAPNTITVPSGSPHAVSVGGTSMTLGAGGVYAGETWWDGSTDSPPQGQGGFGVSRFFARPNFQSGFTSSPMRSIPDIAFNSDPYEGTVICQASAGGCPAPLLFGGTSGAAPAVAAAFAIVNQARGENAGHLNASIYPLANSGAFHTPASIGSDFAHVGLGSPKFNALYLALENASPGSVSAIASSVTTFANAIPADGATAASIVVHLRDGNGNTIRGKAVALTASAGSHATITPASGISSNNDGSVVFSVKNASVETVTFSARDTSDNVTLTDTIVMPFVVPPATSAGIMAFPTTVAANGIDHTSITITLRDANDNPTPGKEIALAQNGRSIAVGPNPLVTDTNGQIVFTATDTLEETVTYTAVDVTDGNLPVPGTAVVAYSGSATGSCVVPPTPAEGYTLTPFVNGFAAYPFFFGNINFGCSGATDAAFDVDGNAFIAHAPTGALYRFGPDGGSATVPLANNLGPSLHTPVFGREGHLYSAHSATTGNFFTGDIVEIDPVTGTVVRQLATNLTCPGGLAVDPLSGDLFFTDICFGAGADNPALFRLTDPAGTDPDRPTAVVTYATLPRTPNGLVAFAPNGTIYVATGYTDPVPAVVKVSATNASQPPTVETVADVPSIYWVNVGASAPDGSARSLIVLQPGSGPAADLNVVDLTTDPPAVTTIAHNLGSGTIGPDGCLYSATADTIYRLTPESGLCDFAATNPSPALALSPRVIAPNPQQGSTLTLTATFRNLPVPEDSLVFLRISGANPQSRLGRTDVNGVATISYEGRFAGDDVAFVNAIVGSVGVVSNEVRIHWDSGPHVTYLSIVGPATASAGVPATMRAVLQDVALDPEAALAGALVHFNTAGQSCDATTNAQGIANCSLTLPNPGAYTLTASYAGNASHVPASTSQVIVVPIDGIDLIFKNGFDSN
jgi:kumamolisin